MGYCALAMVRHRRFEKFNMEGAQSCKAIIKTYIN
jgi:hypothetical protein